MAKATLLEPTLQAGGTFTTIEGVLLEVGVPTEISTHNAMLYMDSHNIKVDFEDGDFKDMDESVLENMSKKLSVDTTTVKDRVLSKGIKPKKTLTKKATEAVKSTLKGVKPKKEEVVVEEIIVEEPVVEETNIVDSSSDE